MIKRFIQNLALDKKEHIIVGVIYSIMIIIGGFILGDIGSWIGFFIGTFLNLYKEIWHDWRQGKGNAELLDFIYNEIPILLVLIAYFL